MIAGLEEEEEGLFILRSYLCIFPHGRWEVSPSLAYMVKCVTENLSVPYATSSSTDLSTRQTCLFNFYGYF